MSHFDLVESTPNLITRATLTENLRNLGVEANDVIMPHISLSSIGWICGGAEALILAMVDAIGVSGTLVMPAMNSNNTDPKNWVNPPVPESWWDGIRNNMPPFKPESSPTANIGCVPELFRTLPNVLRSNHPSCSVAALGSKAQHVIESHQLEDPFGETSPFRKLYDLDAKILLVGVGYDTCSILHLAETRGMKLGKVSEGSAVVHNNQRIWKDYDMPEVDSDRFPDVGEKMESTLPKSVNKGKIGNSNCTIFQAKSAVDFFEAHLA